MTLPRKLYKMNPRVQKKDTLFWFDGVLKLTPLDEFVFLTVLPRPWHRPGSSWQAQTWSDGPSPRIVQDASAWTEIGCIFWVFSGTKDEPVTIFLNFSHVAGNNSNVPQTTTIYRLRSVIKCVLWFISNGALVAEIWPFQVLGYWEVPKLSLLMVYC